MLGILCLSRFLLQLQFRIGDLCLVTTHAEIMGYVSVGIKDWHDMERQIDVSSSAVAHDRWERTSESLPLPLVHATEVASGSSMAVLFEQSDGAQFRQPILSLAQVTEEFQNMRVRVVAHQLDIAYLQRVVDIVYISLNIFGRRLQLSAHLTLVMV